jgi:hypothetical protein
MYQLLVNIGWCRAAGINASAAEKEDPLVAAVARGNMPEIKRLVSQGGSLCVPMFLFASVFVNASI